MQNLTCFQGAGTRGRPHTTSRYLATIDMDLMPESIRLQNFKIGLVDASISPPKTIVQGSTTPQLQEMEHRSDNSDMDEGAQPLSKLQTPPGQGILDSDTRRLISRFLGDFTGLSTAAWIQSKAQSTMKRVVTRLADRHRILFNNSINELSLDKTGLDVSFVSQVARTEFDNGNINWGRIASLLAFCAVLSQTLKENQQERCVELVAQEVSTYLLSHQRTWLVQHNGWDGFAEFFKEDDLESSVRNVLLGFVGLVSVTAALRCLIR